MTSKYEILKHHILEQILNGELVKGQKLPTESEMMAAFSVSRYTVRRAISDLENDHYVYRVQGVALMSLIGKPSENKIRRRVSLGFCRRTWRRIFSQRLLMAPIKLLVKMAIHWFWRTRIMSRSANVSPSLT